MTKEQLVEGIRLFLIEANKHGYGSENPAVIKEANGSKTIVFASGDWEYYDNYFGGEPYGGQTVVFYQGRAVWMMVYYGHVFSGNSPNRTYEKLRKALASPPDDLPVRGPQSLPVGGSDLYENFYSGSIEKFKGTEKISKAIGQTHPCCRYEATYMGGLIDQPRK